MRGAPMPAKAGRKTVSLLDLLRGESLLGISVDDSRGKVITELGEPTHQDVFVASGDKLYKYHDIEMAFFRDNDQLYYVVLYGKGRAGKFRCPWFITHRGRITRDISYKRMINLLKNYKIEYCSRKSVGEDDKRIDIKNGEIIFFKNDEGAFLLYGIYLNKI
ncbi:hypothetical protein [Ancylobacter aquaticus]|uniref:hypothetical protein n=1 Tax=Ancylobacter aquaticus TaxID=100 RepID=UPI001045017D|nr:hypothetical protein [Ancylobacter aquaticus]